MRYIKFTYVDSVTGISIAEAPALNGPVFPAVAGLEFAWARESRYPTAAPEFFGTCPPGSDIAVPGVLGEYVEADWLTMRDDEMRARPSAISNEDRIRAEIMDGVQRYLDDFARTKTYDGILSACTYATSTVPRFAAEGQYCVQARDACWAAVASIEADVMAGNRPAPSGFEDIRAELPALSWPA